MTALVSELAFARHYSQRLRTIGQGLFEGAAPTQAAFRAFETDRDNIIAAFALVRLHWAQSAEWTGLAARFSFGAGRLLSFRLEPERRTEWLVVQLAAARHNGDREGEGAALGELGLALRALGRLPESIASHNQAITLAETLGDTFSAACEFGNLGIAYSVAGRHEDAITAFERQLDLLGDGEPGAAALGRNNLIISLLELGELERAIDELAIARKAAVESDDMLLEARLLGSAAGILADQRERAGAIAAYREQYTLARLLDDRGVEANALIGIALVLADFGEDAGAERRLRDAVIAARAGNDRQTEAIALINLARMLAARGLTDDARRAASQALDWYRAVADPFADDVAAMLSQWSGGGAPAPP